MNRITGKLGLRLQPAEVKDPVEKMVQAMQIADPTEREVALSKISSAMTKKQRIRWRERRTEDVLRTMVERFPAIRYNLPLAVGTDLLAACPDLPKTAVRYAVHVHIRSAAYIEALAAEGAMRHDLDGTPVEPVAEKHAKNARQKRAKLLLDTRGCHKNKGDARTREQVSSKSL